MVRFHLLVRLSTQLIPERQSQAGRFTTLCRQETRLPWHHAFVGRKHRAFDHGDKLAQKVGSLFSFQIRGQKLIDVCSLNSDMNHANMYIVGLALCTFANISSEEMSRDLANEVEKLLGSSNVYIRKKVGPTAQKCTILR